MADNLQNWQNAIDNRFEAGQDGYLSAIPDLANANATAEAVSGGNLQIMQNLNNLGGATAQRMDKFAGLQDSYASDAFGYNSQARQDQVASRAQADVAKQFGDMRQQTQRQMSRTGVNPASGKMLALNNQLGISQAAAQAYAANKARTDLDNTANERQKIAIGFGANLPSQAISAGQNAVYAGNAAANAAQAPLTNRLNFAGGISNIYGNAANDFKGIYQTTNLTAAQQADQARLAQTSSDNQDASWLNMLGSFAGSKSGEKLIDKGFSWLTGGK